MIKLTKVYATDCKVCETLGDGAKALAEEAGFEYQEVELSDLARDSSPIRDYVSHYYVDKEGMVEIPIYLLSTDQGKIQGSSVVKTLEEVANLIAAWQKWESSQKQ